MKNASGRFAVAVAVLAGFVPLTVCMLGQQPSSPSASAKVPLEFEANRGQAPVAYPYVAHAPTYSLGLSATEIALSLHRPHEGSDNKAARLEAGTAQAMDRAQVHLRLLGANKNASAKGFEPRPGFSNYFLGNDPSKWQTHVPHFGGVEIDGTYAGIDLVFYGNPQQLEYDFRVAPGADPKQIRLDAGTTSAALDREGNLVLGTAAGEVQLKRPEAYQVIDGVRKPVQSQFHLGAKRTVEFELGAYDRTKPLIIDPVLLYAVSIGGSNGNQAIGMDVDATGNAYVTGNSCSSDFPSTAGSFGTSKTNIEVPYCQDAFVLKLDPTASTLLYADYIGGSIAQTGMHVAVDASGDAFVTGATGSNDFPLVNNIGPASPEPCGFSQSGFNCMAGFVFKLSPDGSQLLFSSLLGGSQSAGGFQVKLNPVSGDLLVLGETNSANFKPAPTTLETTYAGGSCPSGIPCENAFLLGLNSGTGALKYGTFFGGAGYVVLTGLSTDSTGDIYVTGSANGTLSSSLGSVTHTYAPNGATAGGADAFVARLHLAGTTLSTVYMTLIEGELDDGGSGIAIDASQNAYIVGSTASLHLPVTSGAYQSTNTNAGGNSCLWQGEVARFLPTACGTGFVAKLTSAGALSFLTYLGGSNQTWGEAVGVDSTGNIWLTGVTSATNFPFSADAYSATSATGITLPGQFNPYNPFLAEMSNTGSALPFASPIASSPGQSTDIRIDSSNNVYVTGFGSAAPTTPNVYPANPDVYNPIFIQKWGGGPQPILTLSSTSLTFPPTPYGGISPTQAVTATNTGGGVLELNIQFSVSIYNSGNLPSGFAESDNCGTSLAAGASCNINVTFEPVVAPSTCLAANGCFATAPGGEILIETNTAPGSQSIQIGGTTGHGAGLFVSPNPIVFSPQAAGTASAAVTVFVDSSGDLPLQVGSASIGGTNAADFQLASIGTCANPVPLGEIGCHLTLVFSPSATATGTRTASLILIDNAGDSPQSIPITGLVTGSGPGLIVTSVILPIGSSGPLSNPVFVGDAVIGVTSVNSEVEITLANPSTDTNVQVTSLTFGGANQADFVGIPVTYPATLPLTIAKGTSAAIQVQFLPVAGAKGLRTATLTLGTSPAVTGLPVITLMGDAVTNTDGILSYISDPSLQDFGSLQIGQSSYAGQNLLSISARELGSADCANGITTFCGGPLIITSLVTGLSDYTVVPQQTTGYCATSPLTIPPGYGCGYEIVFSPTAAGNRNTTLTINSNDPMGPTVIPLLGSGLALPLGNLSLTALNFGNSAIGIASPPLTVTLQNVGESNLTVSGATATAGYSVTSNTCASPVAPNATCIIGVSFTPPVAGVLNGTLTITDNDYFNAQQVVALSGTGANGALLRISPSTLGFGQQGLNLATTAQISLANTGSGAVTFPANAFRIDNPDYTIQSTTCGSSLAQGASCAVVVQFKPSSPYTDNGTLLITDNAMGNPQPIYMAGFGTSANKSTTMTLVSSLNPAASGQPVTFTVTVTGTGGNNPVPTGTVTFSENYSSTLGTATLNASGIATLTTSSLNSGSSAISAIYSGDAVYASYNSPSLTQAITGSTKKTTTTTVVPSQNPTPTGQSVTLTATVTPAAGSTTTPTGTVNFLDGVSTIGSGTLNAGEASFSTSTLATGSNSITASYGGDSNFTISTSIAVNLVVNSATKTTPTVTVAPASSGITTAQSLSVTVTVNGGTGNPTPSGSVTLTSGTYTSGAATLSGGSATINIPAGSLATALDTLTVSYTPDTSSSSTYNSASGTASVTVAAAAKATPTVTVAPASSSITTAQSLSVTVTVGGGAGNPTPTGSVTLTSGSYTSATATLSGGSATINIPAGSLATALDTLTVSYTPDSSSSSTYNSASGTASVTVTAPAKTTPTVTVAPASSSITTAQSLSVTVTVGGGAGNPTPTGSVTLTSGTYISGATTLSGGGATINIPAGSLATAPDTLTVTYTPDTSSSSTYNSASGTASVTVTAAPSGFTATSSPTTLSIAAGAATGNTSTITLAQIGSFTGSANLTCSIAGPNGAVSPAICGLSPSTVTIAPTAVTSTLTVTTTTATTPGAYTVTVTGTSGATTATSAVNVTVAPAVVTGTVTLSSSGGGVTISSPGGNGAATITVMPSGGFTGSVTLTAALTSSPTGAQYPPTLSFGSTSPVVITGSSPGNATLTVSTTAPTSGTLTYPAIPRGYVVGGAMLASVLLFGIAGPRRRLRLRLGLVLFLGMLASNALGCGGKSEGGGGSGTAGTTVGSYIVTVTATSGATTAQSTVAVTVN
jgi:Bacterial Ig-like domain (group 3)/Abnormal spindle-like microcephaly-assoc'd, ASPM-SPD-2-Hydin/Beta-propeller repeat